MSTRIFLLSFGLAGAVTVGTAADGQHEGHQAGAAVTPPAAQVNDCRQAQPVITELVNFALKRLEDARLTNSAAAMRDAADDVQAALVDVRTQLAPCSAMPVAADAQPAHTMPATATSGANPAGSPLAQPRPSVGATAGGDPHAGHATPAATQAPRTAAGAAAGPRATPPGSPASAAAEPHVGHTGQPTAASRTPPASTTRPSSPTRSTPASDAHVGHVPPPASPPQVTSSTSGRTSAAAPPTNIAELQCSNAVDSKTAPRMLYQGRMYYFCTDASRAEFAKDPATFVTAPPQAAPAHAH